MSISRWMFNPKYSLISRSLVVGAYSLFCMNQITNNDTTFFKFSDFNFLFQEVIIDHVFPSGVKTSKESFGEALIY